MDSTPHPGMTSDERNKLVEEYLPLVQHVLGRLTIHLPTTLDREDLFEVGVLGLMQATQTFNPSKGAAFKTHAFTNIRGSILDEIRKHDPIPRSRRDRVKLLDEVERKLFDQLGRTPTPEEIAQAAGLTIEQVEESLVNAHGATMLSLEDQAADDGDHLKLSNCLALPKCEDPADVVAKAELKEQLAAAIMKLPERERRVVVLYYAEGLRLKEIGAVLGITESRVCQLHARAVLKLNQEIAGTPAKSSKEG
jgi:RNA polymerase sigma factor for flagellar operon FliA